MLQNLSKKVRLCMRKAEESANHAKFEADPDLVRDLLAMEQRWLKLARSYQFRGVLAARNGFTIDGELRRAVTPSNN
jgi:hypothetical protein